MTAESVLYWWTWEIEGPSWGRRRVYSLVAGLLAGGVWPERRLNSAALGSE